MGVLSSVLGLPAKARLIRSLVVARGMAYSGSTDSGLQHRLILQVEALSMVELMGMPEATVLTIVETLADLTQRGVPVANAIFQIERHRSTTVRGPGVPEPHHPVSFIAYRVLLEHGANVPGLTDAWFRRTVLTASQHFAFPIREADLYAPDEIEDAYVGPAPVAPPPAPMVLPAPAAVPPQTPEPAPIETAVLSCPFCEHVNLTRASVGEYAYARCGKCNQHFDAYAYRVSFQL